jgi:hypothetical protein
LTDPSFVEEKVPFQNTYMPRREEKSWSWLLRRLKPRMTVLSAAAVYPTDQLTDSQMQWGVNRFPRKCTHM